MEIVCDERKQQQNLDKHGLDFAALDLGFFVGALIIPAKEQRYLAIGEWDGRIIVAVVFAALGAQALSVISMRPASRRKRTLL